MAQHRITVGLETIRNYVITCTAIVHGHTMENGIALTVSPKPNALTLVGDGLLLLLVTRRRCARR